MKGGIVTRTLLSKPLNRASADQKLKKEDHMLTRLISADILRLRQVTFPHVPSFSNIDCQFRLEDIFNIGPGIFRFTLMYLAHGLYSIVFGDEVHNAGMRWHLALSHPNATASE